MLVALCHSNGEHDTRTDSWKLLTCAWIVRTLSVVCSIDAVHTPHTTKVQVRTIEKRATYGAQRHRAHDPCYTQAWNRYAR